MSEPIPESIPTSSDRRSHRPTKKRALTPLSQQSQQVEALFARPDQEIAIPNGPKQQRGLAPPPEIVANVQGSSAGAGSGEFHVYKASRRREYERLRLMDEETAKEKADAEFEAKKEELRRADEEKLSKNRAKREKAKARKAKAKGGGEKDGVMEGEGEDGKENGVKKKLAPKKVHLPGGEQANGEAAKEGDAGGEDGEHAAEEGGGITFVEDD